MIKIKICIYKMHLAISGHVFFACCACLLYENVLCNGNAGNFYLTYRSAIRFALQYQGMYYLPAMQVYYMKMLYAMLMHVLFTWYTGPLSNVPCKIRYVLFAWFTGFLYEVLYPMPMHVLYLIFRSAIWSTLQNHDIHYLPTIQVCYMINLAIVIFVFLPCKVRAFISGLLCRSVAWKCSMQCWCMYYLPDIQVRYRLYPAKSGMYYLPAMQVC